MTTVKLLTCKAPFSGITEDMVGGVVSGAGLPPIDEHPKIRLTSKTADTSRNNFFINQASFRKFLLEDIIVCDIL
jgi:hypothetical protein